MSTITRLERAAPIFARVSGLIRSGQLKWEDRPLWYDIYAAHPPFEDPNWDLKMPKADEPVRKLFYKEDVLRAKFYNRFRSAGIIQIENSNKESLSQQFIEQYETELKENPNSTEEEIFNKTISVLEENGLLKMRKTVSSNSST
uniref:Ribosomal protein S23 mitochondrial conserved domain-containing protein n=1 Tax=Panagrolaimus sp. JU765 TaxID=591449 RepID=A0AC34R646_9BILA